MVQSLRRSKSFRILFNSPELVEEQRSGFHHFLKHGIAEELSKISFLEVKRQNVDIEVSLDASTFQLIAPDDNSRNCIIKMKTYACKLYVQIRIVWKKKSGGILMQTEPEWVLLAHLPMMTKRGHFVINGSPRVIVHQVVRAPGVYFQKFGKVKKDERNKARFYGDIIPRKGVWVRLQISKTGQVEIKLKKSTKVQAEMVERCLAVIEKQELSKGRTPQAKLLLDPPGANRHVVPATSKFKRLFGRPKVGTGTTFRPNGTEVDQMSSSDQHNVSRQIGDCSAQKKNQHQVDQSTAWVHRTFGLLLGSFANSAELSTGFARAQEQADRSREQLRPVCRGRSVCLTPVGGECSASLIKTAPVAGSARPEGAANRGFVQQPERVKQNSRPRSESMAVTGIFKPLGVAPEGPGSASCSPLIKPSTYKIEDLVRNRSNDLVPSELNDRKHSDSGLQGFQNRTFVVRARTSTVEKVRSRASALVGFRPNSTRNSVPVRKPLAEPVQTSPTASAYGDSDFVRTAVSVAKQPKGRFVQALFANRAGGRRTREHSASVRFANPRLRSAKLRLATNRNLVPYVDNLRPTKARAFPERIAPFISRLRRDHITGLENSIAMTGPVATALQIRAGKDFSDKFTKAELKGDDRAFTNVYDNLYRVPEMKELEDKMYPKGSYIPIDTEFKRDFSYKHIFATFKAPWRYSLGKVGRHKLNKKFGLDLTENQLTSLDVQAARNWLYRLRDGKEIIDDIDHFQNRRVRQSGELIQNQFENGVTRLRKLVRRKLRTPTFESLPFGSRSYEGFGRPKPCSAKLSSRLSCEATQRPGLTQQELPSTRMAFAKAKVWQLRCLDQKRFLRNSDDRPPVEVSRGTPSEALAGPVQTSPTASAYGAYGLFGPAVAPKGLKLGFVKLTRSVGVIPLSEICAAKLNKPNFRFSESHTGRAKLLLSEAEQAPRPTKLRSASTEIVAERGAVALKFGRRPTKSLALDRPTGASACAAKLSTRLAKFFEPIQKSSLFSRSTLWKIRESLCFYTIGKPQQIPQWQLRINSKRTPFHSFIPRLLLTDRRGLLSQTWPRNLIDRRYDQADREVGRLFPTKSRLWTAPSVGFAQATPTVAEQPKKFSILCTIERSVNKTTPAAGFAFVTPAKSSIVLVGQASAQRSLGAPRPPSSARLANRNVVPAALFSRGLSTAKQELSLSSASMVLRSNQKPKKLENFDHPKTPPLGLSRSQGRNVVPVSRVTASKPTRFAKSVSLKRDLGSVTRALKQASELFSTKPINGALREFFGSNPLSQYMDQTNPLAEVTHKRRISSLGIGGVSRESAGMAIRGIHPTHYGRICPIETPEGKNAGLVNSLALYARLNKHGFIETPYYKVIKGQVQEELGFSFYSALKETVDRLHLAPSDLQQSQANMLGVLDRTVNKPKLRQPQVNSARFLLTKAAPSAASCSCSASLSKKLSTPELRSGWREHPASPKTESNQAISGQPSKASTSRAGRTVGRLAGLLSSVEQAKGSPPGGEPRTLQSLTRPCANPDGSAVELATTFVQGNSGCLVPVRVADTLLDVFKKVSPYEVDCIGISPVQILSVATSLIPFLEHNDANRALMGSNMQRQAVPLMISERPIVGTGLEALIAAESGQLIQSSISGIVSHVSASKIIIERLFNTAVRIDSAQQSNGFERDWATAGPNKPSVCTGPARAERGAVALEFGVRPTKVLPQTLPESVDDQCRAEPQTRASHAGTTLRLASRPKALLLAGGQLPPVGGFQEAEHGRLLSGAEHAPRTSFGLFGTETRSSATGLVREANTRRGLKPSTRRNFGCYVVKQPRVLSNRSGVGFAKISGTTSRVFACSAKLSMQPEKTWAWATVAPRRGAPRASLELPKAFINRSLARYAYKTSPTASAYGASDFVRTALSVAKQPKGRFVQASLSRPVTLAFRPLRGQPERSSGERFTLALAHSPEGRVPEQVLSEAEQAPSADFAFVKPARSSYRFTDTYQQHLLRSKSSTLLPFVHSLRSFSRSNQETCLIQKPLVQEGEWVQKGDLLTDCSASEKGELAVGKNVLIAYLPWEGYNFEDAIVVSDRLTKEQIYASLHIERYVCEAQDIKEKITNSNEWFTRHLPGVHPKLVSHLDTFGFPKIGTILKEGDILVGKMRYFRNKPTTPYEKLLSDILGDGHFSVSLTSLRVPKGVHEARVISHRVVKTFRSSLETTVTGVPRPAGTPKMVHIFLGEKRSIQIGDKMSGRHGNKGIISTILPKQDMPYLPDGSPIDILLNPLGVPSRMNVGQIFESLLGLASTYLNQKFKITAFDELYGVEASQSLVYLKLYQARLQSGQNWLFQINFPGKTRLIDGRSGECFDQWVTVGRAYMLKLIHMVNEKIHARNTGPYALITQQPLRGRSQKGGQRLGEMEVWALEGYGAAYILQELLTKKSDDFAGRQEIINSLVVRSDRFSSPDNPYRDYSNPDDPYQRFSDPDNPYQVIQETRLVLGHPEIFKTLICELQALCLDVGVYALKKESFQREYLGIVN